MFEVFALVFLSFRFNNNARVKKRGILLEMLRKLKRDETLKSLERASHEKNILEDFVSDTTIISSFGRVALNLGKC